MSLTIDRVLGTDTEPAQRADDASLLTAVIGGIGAWIATVCFTVFLAVVGLIHPGTPGPILVAIFFGVGAAWLQSAEDSDRVFSTQLMLASTFMAQIAALAGVAELGAFPTLGLMTVVCSLVYVVVEHPASRVVTSAIWISIATGVLGTTEPAAIGLLYMLFLAIPCIVLAAPKLFEESELRQMLVPLAHVASFAAMVLCFDGLGSAIWASFPTVARIATAVAAAAVAALAYLETPARHRTLFAVAIAIGALGMISTPGIMLALLFAALGLWRGDWVMTILGGAGLSAHLAVYYYNLDVTLLAKSGVLVATGAVLLVLRAIAFGRGASHE